MHEIDCDDKFSAEIGEEILNLPLVYMPVELINISDKKAFAVRDYLVPSFIKFKFRNSGDKWIVSIK
jgi:hypothetical protein